MKRFLTEIILLIALTLGTVFIIYNYDTSNSVKKFKNIEKTFDVINLGTSHGNSFIYDELPLSGERFNRTGNTPYYDLQNYKFVKQHLKKGATIILPISYFSFGLDENRTDMGDDNSFVLDFYYYLPKSYIYNFSDDRKVQIFIYRVQKNLQKFFSLKTKPKKSSKKKKHKQFLINHAKRRVKSHMKLGTFSSSSKNIEYYSELLKDASNAGFKVILVTTPFYNEYNKNFDTEWLKENYYSHIETLRTTYNIPHLDFGSDKRMSNSPELFENSDHLNKEGKKIFCEIFFRELDSLKLLPINF